MTNCTALRSMAAGYLGVDVLVTLRHGDVLMTKGDGAPGQELGRRQGGARQAGRVACAGGTGIDPVTPSVPGKADESGMVRGEPGGGPVNCANAPSGSRSVRCSRSTSHRWLAPAAPDRQGLPLAIKIDNDRPARAARGDHQSDRAARRRLVRCVLRISARSASAVSSRYSARRRVREAGFGVSCCPGHGACAAFRRRTCRRGFAWAVLGAVRVGS